MSDERKLSEQVPDLSANTATGNRFIHSVLGTVTLKAPYPYPGGKSAVAALVWARLGDVDNFCEPFAGSAAVLLARPHAPRIETLNDRSIFIANFFRAIRADPEAVAYWASDSVDEAQLHARHRWLVGVAEPEPVVPPEFDHHPIPRRAYLAGYARLDGSYARAFRRRMRTDPDHFDVRVAGWWVWGACCWIGSGWCEERATSVPDQMPRAAQQNGSCTGGNYSGVLGNPPAKRPQLHTGNSAHGRGVHGEARLHENIPDLSATTRTGNRFIHSTVGADPLKAGRPQLADAYARGRGVHGTDDAGTCQQRLDWLTDWFGRLSDRLRTVRVCCGHWKRVCGSPSTTTRLGLTGIFLDGPYPTHGADGSESRAPGLYGAGDEREETDRLRDEVLAYAIEHGHDPQMRLVIAGYDTDGYGVLVEKHGWDVEAWRSRGGYSNRNPDNKNRDRERLYYSPHCLKPGAGQPVQASLFGGEEAP